jgi:hypothetical protein
VQLDQTLRQKSLMIVLQNRFIDPSSNHRFIRSIH